MRLGQKTIKNIGYYGIGLFLLLTSPSLAITWEGNTDDKTWQSLKTEAIAQQSKLDELVSQAQNAGINTDYAFVSQVVLNHFIQYAQYDRSNPEVLEETFKASSTYKYIPKDSYLKLPFDELQDCIDVARYAIAELQNQLRKNITLQPPVDFSKSPLKLKGRYYRQGDRIAIPSAFNFGPDDEDIMQAFGRMGGSYYAISHIDSSGTHNPRRLNTSIEKLKSQDARNMGPQDIFLGHAAAKWMLDQHPEIKDGGRNFTRYCIDNPLIRQWMTTLFEEYLPKTAKASGTQSRIHLLANEPHFATKKKGWLVKNGISSFTMDKYQKMLETKYQRIEVLNETYGSSFADFQAAKEGFEFPIDPVLQGGPIWYDWCRFNMDRVINWYRFLKVGVKTYDPTDSPANIKMLPVLFDVRDHGMDLEALSKLQDMNGADFKVQPMGATDFWKKPYEYRARNAYGWLQQTLTLDFVQSLNPNKPFYDSEWHGFSTGHWRDFSLDRNYIRSALWLGFTHGISAINVWVWGRGADGAPTKNSPFVGELLTQPIALDAYGRTMKELNAHAEAIAKLVPRERRFMIYYSEDSAIQDPEYVNDLSTSYEALKLLNLPLGFTTPSEITKLSNKNQMVIVPPTAFISDHDLASLQQFNKQGGKVLLIEPSRSFIKNEHGLEHQRPPSIMPVATIELDEVWSLANKLNPLLSPHKIEKPISVMIKDSDGKTAYGVIAQQTLDKNTRQSTLVLNNVCKDSRMVILNGATAYKNLITGKRVSNKHILKPYDVLLLKASHR